MKKNPRNKNFSDHKNKWKKTILSIHASVQDCLKNLNKSGLRISLIVNDKEEFQGTVTDGDIRKALVDGIDLKNSIRKIINRNAFIVSPEMKSETVLQIMIKNKVQQIPVINESQKITGLYLWDEVISQKKISNTMVVMAGGKGTRLGKYTKNCPKPLLPVNGKPMLEQIIDRAKIQGFENFVISINYLGKMIEDYFGNGKKWDIKINYIKENQPLGTAGSLSLLSPKPKHPIIVSNCDIMTDINYEDLLNFHNNHKADATMAVRIHEWENPYGVVRTRGIDIVDFEEKPIIKNNINAGVYVLEPSVIKDIKKNKNFDMPDLFELLKKKNLKTIVYPVHELWLDVGRPEDYYKVK